ncbi:MAG: hypothetical protein ACI4M6_04230 [Christensenellaceae bacterium]
MGTNITYASPDTVTLAAGTYYILFNSTVSNTEGGSGDLGATMQINGVDVPTATVYTPTQTSFYAVQLQHLATVANGTTLRILNGTDESKNYATTTLFILKVA